MVDEAALQARGLWTAFTPAGASEESSKGMTALPNSTLGVPVDPSNPIRTLKDQYINEIKSKEGLTLSHPSEDNDNAGFSFVVGFSAPPSTLGYAYSDDAEPIQTPSFYVQFTLGRIPEIAFYVGDKLHYFKADDDSYGFLGGGSILKSLTITEKELRLIFGNNNSLFFSFEIMNGKAAGAFNPKTLSNWTSYINKESPFYEMGKPFRAFDDGTTTVYAFTTVSPKILESIADNLSVGMESGRSALWFNKDVNIYLSADSFTSTDEIESKYLLPLSLDWGSVPSIDASKEHVEIKISMESAADATDNYTGRVGGSETLAATLIFPGDEAKLAPISVKDGEEVFCGQDGRIGRTLNDVKVSEGQVWLSFTDGTEVMFPHPEYQTLSAKDKITGQILTGKVLDIQKVSGSASEAYADVEEQRKKDNLDTTFAILDENGKSVTRALAWRDGEKNEYLKILVPSGKGAKMLTIKLTEA